MLSSHQFHGDETFGVPRDTLWRFLTDLRNVPSYVPNLQEVQFPAPDTVTGKLVTGFSFLKGTLDLAIQITGRCEPSSAQMTITSRGVGSRAILTGAMELPEVGAGPTLLRWQVVAQLEGLLGAVSKGLIEGAARKLIADTFQAIRKHLAGV